MQEKAPSRALQSHRWPSRRRIEEGAEKTRGTLVLKSTVTRNFKLLPRCQEPCKKPPLTSL
ncbi:unnamed protein product, partial [Pleuronectes platessa]